MTKKHRRILIAAICVMAVLRIILTLCEVCAVLAVYGMSARVRRWYYTSEDGVFRTQDGSFVIDFRRGDAVFMADGERIELDNTSMSATYLELEFCEHVPDEVCAYYISRHESVPRGPELLIVEVEAKKRAKTLTLTVTGGALEEYVGNVYFLEFYPDEELNLDAVTTQEAAEDSGTTGGK